MRVSRSLITVATFGSLAVAATVSLLWLVTASGTARFEPAVETLGLLAGLTGVFAERRAAARERREVTVAALARELAKAAAILDGSGFSGDRESRRHVYPRLPLSATDAALTSGALAERDDAVLLGLLNDWRDDVTGFNRRLELTELRLFGTPDDDEALDFDRALRRTDGYLYQLRRHLRELRADLTAHHPVAAGGPPAERHRTGVASAP